MGYLLRWRLSASQTCSYEVKLRCCCGKIQKWLSKICLLHLASSFDLGVIMVIGVICVTFWVAYRVIIAQSSVWATRHVGTTCASNQTTGFNSTSLWISIRVIWGFDQGHLDWIKAGSKLDQSMSNLLFFSCPKKILFTCTCTTACSHVLCFARAAASWRAAAK